jgi:hypothetical protein
MPLNLRGTAAAILSLVTVSGAETAFGKSLAGFLYRLPGIPRCSRVIRQASHLWWYRRCQHTFFAANRERRSRGRLARHESGRVCQRVLMIANLLEGMEHEEAARLAGLSRSPRPTSAQKLRDTISLRIRASEAAVKPWPMPNSTFTGSPL